MPAAREGILRAARAVGVEPRLRQVQRALERGEQRRNRRDNDHQRVVLAAVLAPSSGVLDIGANVGEVLEEVVRCAPDGRHIAYEPLPDLADALARRFPGVEVRNAALADEPGEATFYRVKGSSSRSSLRQLDYASDEVEPLTVRVDRLDDAIPADYTPTLVKIDVEGAEEQVLRGGLGLLRRAAPVVLLEHGAGARHFGTSSGTVFDLLTEGAGLRVYDIDGGGPYDRAGFETCTAAGDIWTFLARP